MGNSVEFTYYGRDGWKVVVVAVLLIILQSTMLCGRCVSRRLQKVSLAADDYVLFLSAALTMALCALGIAFPRIAGATSGDSTIQSTTSLSDSLIGQSFMAWTMIYGLSTALSKIAVLLLYIRVFTTCNRAFTVTACIVAFVIVGTCIANTLLTFLDCSAQSLAWGRSVERGTCVNVATWSRFIAIPNVVTGAVMLFMPLPIVWKLNFNVAAKVALTAAFLHGTIGFAASCARLGVLCSSNANQSSDNTSLVWTIWTINEPANYIITSCLPMLRPIFVRIFPASFFILSHRHPSKRLTSTSLKVSWPRRFLAPKFRLESGRFQNNSRISGPWNTINENQATGEDGTWVDVEEGIAVKGQREPKKDKVIINTMEIGCGEAL